MRAAQLYSALSVLPLFVLVCMAAGAWAGTVSTVSPSVGSPSGGFTVTITGTNIGNGGDITAVFLAGVSVSSINSQSSTTVTVTAGASGGAMCGDATVMSTSRGTSSGSSFSYNSTCSSCSAGQYCSGDTCVQCTAGFYCTGGTAGAVPCPAGQTSSAGATSSGSCSACPDGTYSPGGSACLACAAGYRCPSKTVNMEFQCAAGTFSPGSQTSCTACNDGTYALAGSSACLACAAGYRCPSKTVNMEFQCAAGTYSVGSQTSCTACNNGQYAIAGSSGCLACAAGYACPSKTQNMESICSAGTYSSGSQTSCIACTTGTVATGTGATACVNCPAGFACPTVGTTSGCPSGSYSLAGETFCHGCLPGTYCSTTTALPVACPTTRYNDVYNRTICKTCTAGSRCQSTGMVAPDPCNDGQYAPASSSVCSTCSAGYACPSKTVNQETLCSAGTYSAGGQTACIACTTGNVATSTGSTSCIPCPAGFACPTVATTSACSTGSYSLASETSCTPCPAGSQCPSTSVAPSACSAGTYSLGSATTCTNCPSGSYCPSTSAGPQACAAGTYSTGGATACTPCATGTYSLASANGCSNCPAGFACPLPSGSPVACDTGYYSAGGTVQTCTLCGAGKQSTADKSGCSNCPAGYMCPDSRDSPTICPAGTFSVQGAAGCTSCPAGSYCPTGSSAALPCFFNGTYGSYSLGGAANCTLCPAGSACASTTGPVTACTSGTYSAEGLTQCVSCPAGFDCSDLKTVTACATGWYSLAGVAACTQCPAGSRCPTKTASPIACPSGRYSLVGATSCTNCPAGSYCPSTDSVPIACNDGYYSSTVATACTICPAGFRCPNPASSSPIACGSGYMSLAGSTSCTFCPEGYACPSQTSMLMNACSNGTYATGGATACTVCPAGSACPSTTSAIVRACAAGSYSAAGSSACTPCPAGYACPTTTALGSACTAGRYSTGSQTVCIQCSAGYACPLTTQALQVQCASGTYALAGATACTPCPAGNYCPFTYLSTTTPCPSGSYSLGAAASCTVCPAGVYCSSTSSSTQTACASGSYSLGGLAACVACTRGYYCPSATSGPIACDVGYYASSNSLTTCTPCPAGSYCPNPANGPSTCPAGYWSGAALESCSPCSPGYLCAAGSTSPTSGTSCPQGYYCPAGAVAAQPCAAGTYGTKTLGESAADACASCSAGYYCNAGSTTPTQNICAQGYYCPAGSTSATQYACPAGTYGPSTGLVQVSQCIDCPAGYYCPAASTTPTALVCPSGHFCPNRTGDYRVFPCPAGTYLPSTGNVNVTDCITCPAGAYCTQGVASFTLCPQGSYNPTSGAEFLGSCLQCTAGMACPGIGMTAPNETCIEGHYCPPGTQYQTQYPCYPGTWTPYNNLTHLAQCSLCPATKACTWGTGQSANPPVACSGGHYCPEGTSYASQFPCPAGTYSASTSLSASSDCTTCPAGQACGGGQTVPDGACAAGYYCPAGTDISTRNPCPAGTYSASTSLSASSDCTSCDLGKFCVAGSTAPTPCYAGTYASSNGTQAATSCGTCPGGSFCVAGTINPPQCSAGQYSDNGASACSACVAGFYCESAGVSYAAMISTHRCPAGLFCPTGTNSTPSAGVAFNCPTAYYCPGAIESPVVCPLGTFNNRTGGSARSDCVACTEGYYCLQGSTNVTAPCAAGYYCDAGSYGPQQKACPAGTYRLTTGARGLFDCATCPAGQYCDTATSSLSACPQGYWCAAGVERPTPCPLGTYGNRTGLALETDCTNCDPRYYCDSLGLSSPTDLCEPRYYCAGRAYVSQPTGVDATGGLCPRGGYCPRGTDVPRSCPAGTFNNVTGAATEVDCALCTPGYYCSGTNNPEPTGPCAPGYYCSSGSSSAFQTAAQPGYYAPAGSIQQTPCAEGTYQPLYNASSCLQCPAGYYCPNVTMIAPVLCPVGQYCVAGVSQPTRCPSGTFSNDTGLRNVTECTACSGGYYCESNGLTSPTGQCTAGFYCSLSSKIANPVSQTFGDVCPPGYYCPLGTQTPIPCPAGTYSSASGLTASASCTQCTPGKYCNASALTAPQGDCAARYYCTLGSNLREPAPDGAIGGICPVGHYCAGGNVAPVVCADGSFSNTTGLSACHPCPAGSYCVTPFVTPTICPAGSYCPDSTGLSVPACPAGRFSPSQGLRAVSECTACTAGTYCATSGLTAPTGNCTAAYYCNAGSSSQLGADGFGGLCPRGEYCPADGLRHECPMGTYLPSDGNDALADCIACTPGYYCNDTGLSAPTGQCSAGHYCTSAATTATPLDGDAHGGPCPLGRHCPLGSAYPLACTAGSYANVTASSACLTCLPRYYCPENTSNPLDFACPTGHYCPSGTQYSTQYPCPASTFQNATGTSSLAECINCVPGSWCGAAGLSQPSGLCDGGYWCAGRANVSAPNDGIVGGRCYPGTFCPSGAVGPHVCTGGYYCATHGLANVTGPCVTGYYCAGSATVAAPTDGSTGNICPSGAYCPLASSAPIACSAGTYTNATGNSAVAQCVACPAGRYCGTSGLSAPSGQCAAGFYCPVGQSQANPPAYPCPAGSFCVVGSTEPVGCPAGKYQTLTQMSGCDDCPLGYYCPGNTSSVASTPCPLGHYCPGNTTNAFQHPCPAGTFRNETLAQTVADCYACTPGRYCATPGLSEPTANCSAGYYCTHGASTPAPTDGSTGNVCPAGSYCHSGSGTPTPCPVGTSTNNTGNTDISGCALCPAGRFCEASGSVSGVTGLCNGGYFCIAGASLPTPHNDSTGRICTPGHYCPAGTTAELNCAAGSFNPDFGQSVCTPCLAGFYCPSDEMTSPIACPAGSYCPQGTINPIGCPEGMYSNATQRSALADCLKCPAGKYCNATALTAPTGDCEAGFWCPGNSSVASSSALRCPAGAYCPTGTEAPLLCNAGTYNALVQQDEAVDCLPCPASRYCASSGMTTFTGNCSATYYCPSGQSTDTPSAYVCPRGHYCPEASAMPLGCAAGTYSPSAGASACIVCPSTTYCPANTSDPILCPVNHYCPAGSGVPLNCPAGTYTDQTGLANATQCTSCPTGMYCVDGNVTGVCAGGFICYGGASSPTPTDGVTGNYCPIGHYCPAGATTPLVCTGLRVRLTVGAAMDSECVACPSGYKCVIGSPLAELCPPGYYCPFNTSALPCPMGTYSSAVGTNSTLACITCPAGYVCNTTAIADFELHPCPSAHYCPSGTLAAIECPAGTYRDTLRAGSASDCPQCPGGFFCPQGTNTSQPCPVREYCPPGSSFPTPCPAGYYCPARTSSPIVCPGGAYCPAGADNYTVCPDGFYCPVGSAYPILCPLGTYFDTSVANRSTVSACTSCPAGTYGTDPARLTCESCTAGYVCLGRTPTATPTSIATDAGFGCPVGYYCPTGSSSATPCPTGTFNNLTLQGNLSACLSCPMNTFQSVSGSSGCQPCGSSAFSLEGATFCTCNGTNRVYQVSDGSCICAPRYEFLDEGLVVTDEDGTADCQPTIFPRCGTSESRLASNGTCAVLTEYCSSCPSGSGTFIAAIGLCECSGMTDASEVCDVQCQLEQRRFLVERDSLTGTVTIAVYDPLTDSMVRANVSNATGLLGSITCSGSSCNTYVLQAVSNGMRGVYDASSTYINDFLTTLIEGGSGTSSRRRRTARRAHGRLDGLDTDAEFDVESEDAAAFARASGHAMARTGTAVQSGVDNPTVCLKVGESMLWDLSGSDRVHFPVYLKDSLLNTNDNFDWGPFRELKTLMTTTSVPVTVFAYTFSTTGVYVFADNADESRVTVLRVLDTSASCPSDTQRMRATNSRNLVQLGVVRDSSIQLSPDWALISLLGAGLILIIVGMIGSLYYFRRKSWSVLARGDVPYRKDALLEKYEQFASKGTTIAKRMLLQRPSFDISLLRGAAGGSLGPVVATAGVPGYAEKDAVAAWMRGASAERAAAAGTVAAAALSAVPTAVVLAAPSKTDLQRYGRAFWDYDRQVDVEGFTISKLYEKLDQERSEVKNQLRKHRAEVRRLFESVSRTTTELRDLLAPEEKSDFARRAQSAEEMKEAEQRKRKALQERQRRIDLSEVYLRSVRAVLAKLNSSDIQRQKFEDSRRPLEKDVVGQLREAARALKRKMRKFSAAEVLEKQQQVKQLVGDDPSALLAAVVDAPLQQCVDALAQSEAKLSELVQLSGLEADRVCVAPESLPTLQSALPASAGTAPQADADGGCVLLGLNGQPAKLRVNARGLWEDADGLVAHQESTGLYLLAPNARMVPPAGSVLAGTAVPVPADWMLEPEAGLVVPIAGHCVVDPQTQQVVYVGVRVDLESVHPDSLPYVPYPTDRLTGEPVEGPLLQLAGRVPVVRNGTFIDPVSGLRCAIVAASLHPTTGNVIPVGGAYADPMSGLPTPIAIEKPMLNPSASGASSAANAAAAAAAGQAMSAASAAVPTSTSSKPLVVPIAGVRINPLTGAVEPVGGSMPGELAGDVPFVALELTAKEAHSGLRRMTGAAAVDDSGDVIPVGFAGLPLAYVSYMQTLDSYLGALANAQAVVRRIGEQLVDAMRDTTLDAVQLERRVGTLREQLRDGMASKDQIVSLRVDALQRARERLNVELRVHRERLRTIERDAKRFIAMGGTDGVYRDPVSGVEIPILVGADMVDPRSGNIVPILGVDTDRVGRLVPVGGMMTNLQGQQVPINTGELVRSPTGEIVPVTGARLDRVSGLVTPATNPEGPVVMLPKRDGDPRQAAQVLREEAQRREEFGMVRNGAHADVDAGRQRLEALLEGMADGGEVTSATVRDVEGQVDAIREGVERFRHAMTLQQEQTKELLRVHGGVLGAQVRQDLVESLKRQQNGDDALLSQYERMQQLLMEQVDELRKLQRRELQLAAKVEAAGDDADPTLVAELASVRAAIATGVPSLLASLQSVETDVDNARDRCDAAFSASKAVVSVAQTSAADRRAVLDGSGAAGAGAGGAGASDDELAGDVRKILQLLSAVATDANASASLSGLALSLPEQLQRRIQQASHDQQQQQQQRRGSQQDVSAADASAQQEVDKALDERRIEQEKRVRTAEIESHIETEKGDELRKRENEFIANALDAEQAAAVDRLVSERLKAAEESIRREYEEKAREAEDRVAKQTQRLQQQHLAELQAAGLGDPTALQQRIKELAEQQARELKDAEGDLAREEKQLREHYEEERKRKLVEIERKLQDDLTTATAQEQRQAIVEAYQRQVEQLEETMASSKRVQQAALENKLAERRARVQARQREQQRMLAERIALEGQGELSGEERKALGEAEQRMAEAEKQYEVERQRQEAQREAELQQASTEAERERVIKQYEQQSKQLEATVMAERRVQRAALEERLAKRQGRQQAKVRAARETLERQMQEAVAQQQQQAKVQMEVEAKIEADVAARREELRAEVARKQLDEEQMTIIKERMQVAQEQLQKRFNLERVRQQDELSEKLERRRLRRERMRVEKQQQAEAAALAGTAELLSGGDGAAGVAPTPAMVAADEAESLLRRQLIEQQELEAQRAQQMEEMKQQLEKLRHAEEERIQKAREVNLQAADTEAKREEIKARAAEELRALEQRVEAERSRQKSSLESRLEARKRKQQQRHAEQQRMLVQDIAEEMESPDAAEHEQAEQAHAEQTVAESDSAGELQQLQRRHMEERAQAERRVNEEIESTKRRRVPATEERLLRLQHQLERSRAVSREVLEQVIERLRLREAEFLEAELALTRARALQAVATKQASEQNAVHLKVFNAAMSESIEKLEARERALCEPGGESAGMSPEESAAALEAVLHERHGLEQRMLTHRFQMKIRVDSDAAASDSDDSFEERKVRAQQTAVESMVAAVERAATSGGAGAGAGAADASAAAELLPALDSVEQTLARSLADLRARQPLAAQDARAETTKQLKRTLAEERLRLRRQQMEEMDERMGEMNVRDVWLAEEREAARRDFSALETFKQQLQSQREERLREIEEQQRAMEDELQREVAAKFEMFKRELEEREKAVMEAEAGQLEKRNQELVKRQEALLDDQLRTVDRDEEREQILAAHRADVERMQQALDAERERQSAQFEKRRQARREKLLVLEQERLKRDAAERLQREVERERARAEQELDEDEDSALTRDGLLLAQEAELRRAQARGQSEVAKMRQKLAEAQAAHEGKEAQRQEQLEREREKRAQQGEGGALSRQQWFELVRQAQSPLLQRLGDLERRLLERMASTNIVGFLGGQRQQTLLPGQNQQQLGVDARRSSVGRGRVGLSMGGAVGGGVAGAALAGVPLGEQYVDGDAGDGAGTLRPMQANALGATQFVVYKFGSFVVNTLVSKLQHRPIQLLLAESLPNSTLTHNAFRNAFHYETQPETLWISSARLRDVGGFVLLVSHCMAHRHVGDMDSDHSAAFQAEWFRCLKVLGAELFFARSRSDTRSAEKPASALLGMFDRLGTEAEKTTIVQDLIDLAADDGTRFDRQQLMARMEKYSTFAAGARLMEQLSSLEEDIADDLLGIDLGLDDVRAAAATAASAHAPPSSRAADSRRPSRDQALSSTGGGVSRKFGETLSATLRAVREGGAVEYVQLLEDAVADLNDQIAQGTQARTRLAEQVQGIQQSLSRTMLDMEGVKAQMTRLREGSPEQKSAAVRLIELEQAASDQRRNIGVLQARMETAQAALDSLQADLQGKSDDLDRYRVQANRHAVDSRRSSTAGGAGPATDNSDTE